MELTTASKRTIPFDDEVAIIATVVGSFLGFLGVNTIGHIVNRNTIGHIGREKKYFNTASHSLNFR